jgi:hypothetical protein
MAAQDHGGGHRLERLLGGALELSAFASIPAMGAMLWLAIAGRGLFGYSTVLCSVYTIEAVASGVLHLVAPRRAVGFWRRYNARRPRWRQAMFTPVDASASRSIGIGSLIVAGSLLLIVSGFTRR